MIWLTEEILHQLRLVVYPIIYRVLAPSRWLFGIFSINLPGEKVHQPRNSLGIWVPEIDKFWPETGKSDHWDWYIYLHLVYAKSR